MKIFKKTIISFFIILAPPFFAADTTQRLTCKQIDEGILQSTALPQVIASLIAQYAEEPIKGFIYIPPKPLFNLSGASKVHAEKYQFLFPELGKSATPHKNVMISVNCTSLKNSSSNGLAKLWIHSFHPDFPANFYFPYLFPFSLLQGKKEGETINVYISNIPFALTCSQLTHRYNKKGSDPLPFEQAFNYITAGLLNNKVKEDKYEDD